MKVTPKTEDEIKLASLYEKGEYDFEVIEAADTASKKDGTEMIKLLVRVFGANGGSKLIDDWLHPAMEAKVRHFCDGAGILEQYNRGEFAAYDCQGRTGKCKLVIEEDKSGQYGPKNSIKDYVVPKREKGAAPAAKGKADPALDPDKEDDNLPF